MQSFSTLKPWSRTPTVKFMHKLTGKEAISTMLWLSSFHSERNHQGNMMRQDKKRRRKKKKKKKRKKKEDKQVGGRVGPDRTETPDKFRF